MLGERSVSVLIYNKQQTPAVIREGSELMALSKEYAYARTHTGTHTHCHFVLCLWGNFLPNDFHFGESSICP